MVREKTAKIIVVSNRIYSGERDNTPGQLATDMLSDAGFAFSDPVIVPEGADWVREQMRGGISQGVSLVLTCGGTGFGPHNLTPEETLELISTRLNGLETQVLIEGLKNTPRAGLSRGVIGLTTREPGGTLVVNAPASRGGVRDTLKVILGLWPNLSEWIG